MRGVLATTLAPYSPASAHRMVHGDAVDRPARTPEANPVEDLWRELKRQIAACLERSLEALLASARRYFDRLTPAEALRTAGITG